ncbi:NTP transferase domain-containing protein, partial [Candidatus Microgenomates bacterium]|nr:NTP transferase domain-containing protein [Candidatus Microgenomates bacterium]
MKAVILAAGDNTRFRKENDKHNKLLHPVLGLPLIERTIKSAKKAGIFEFVIVTGYQDKEIKKLLRNGEKIGVSIVYVHNKSWIGENGTSVYQAKNQLKNENFILLMGDHLFDAKVLIRLVRQKLENDECILAVDKKLEQFPNADEATKVQINNRKVFKIGKELAEFNALDTGMFLCTPSLFSVLAKTINSKKFYLTDAMRVLASDGKLKSFDIRESFWADIDTHQDLYLAEEELFQRLTKPSGEGPISKHINRRFSHLITRYLLKTSLTPNQITLVSVLAAVISGVFLANPSYLTILIGGFLAQLSSIIDGVDGEIARIKLLSSSYGAWFDTILDRYGDIIITTGAAVGVYQANSSFAALVVGALALTGSILSSYSAHTFKTTFGKSFQNRAKKTISLPSGRDVRLFIIFAGAIFNAMLVALLLIAFLTHYSVLY